jgi:hypothetical protein
MTIEHSALMNDFLCFWFQTSVDGKPRFDTILHYDSKSHGVWYTTPAEQNDTILLQGTFDYSQSDDVVLECIQQEVAAAIRIARL